MELSRYPNLLRILALAALAVGTSSLRAQVSPVPYHELDNVEEPWVNLNLPSVRPMCIDNGTDLYSVNTHDSTVSAFDLNTRAKLYEARVPWGPVSIASWNGQLLVVSRGSYVLSFLDAATGKLLDMMELPPEPADILVDGNEAFISCTARDEVVRIRLDTKQSFPPWLIPSKHPMFLSFDANMDVLVAPQHSGNNSGILKTSGFVPEGGPILDLADPNVTDTSLPDHDLFRIDRTAGTVQPILSQMGTILFGNGYDATRDIFWQLATDANNKDPNKQEESKIRGEVVKNIISRANLLPANLGLMDVIDLDDVDGDGIIDPADTVGQPFGIYVDPATGWAIVTGLLTDNIKIFSWQGFQVAERDLPDGSIPRAVLNCPTRNEILVYCWGTNKIEILGSYPGFGSVATLDLGFDPTPPEIQEGRRIYYDAQHSLHNNASCNSCHIDGKTDNIPWNLSVIDKDDKGPMVTQVLTGIDVLVPFHWRGEQQNHLIDFNPAFVNLLGASQELSTGPGSDFEKFESFVLSMRNAANPNQNKSRLVDDSIHAPLNLIPEDLLPATRSASSGQVDFLGNSALTCVTCHAFPKGTANEVVGVGTGNNPNQQFFKPAPFPEAFRKISDGDRSTLDLETALVTFDPATGFEPLEYPVTGSGFNHDGRSLSLHGFIRRFVKTIPDFSFEMGINITDFLWQWDNGIAPAAHSAVHLTNTSSPAEIANLDWLYDQAQFKDTATQQKISNCSIAVIGSVDLGSGSQEVSWYYNRRVDRFIPDDGTLAPQSLDFFKDQATIHSQDNWFLGLPVGSAERFAVDYDQDELYNADELAAGTDLYDSDSDDDGDPDGFEVDSGTDPLDPGDIVMMGEIDDLPVFRRAKVLWNTLSVASLAVETDRITTLTVTATATAPEAPTIVHSIDQPSKVHRVILDDLLPSTMNGPTFAYTLQITATDSFQRSATITRNVTTDERKSSSEIGVVSLLRFIELTKSPGTPGGSITARVEVEVSRLTDGPPRVAMPGQRVGFRALRNLQPVPPADLITAHDTQFENKMGQLYTGLAMPGSWVVSGPTDANGRAEILFEVRNMDPGDELTLNVEVMFVSGPDPVEPFNLRAAGDLFNYSKPDTIKQNRCLSTTY